MLLHTVAVVVVVVVHISVNVAEHPGVSGGGVLVLGKMFLFIAAGRAAPLFRAHLCSVHTCVLFWGGSLAMFTAKWRKR